MDPVKRWAEQLRERVGTEEDEIAARESALHEFCRRHDVTPEELVSRWQEFPQLLSRRTPRTAERPDLAVESFLIHNGVNVFGDIVCVAGRRVEDLAAQGRQFVPDGPSETS